MELTRLLIEAMESWEHKDDTKGLLRGLTSAFMPKDMPPERRAEYERKDEEERLKDERLLRVRDSADAGRIFDEASR